MSEIFRFQTPESLFQAAAEHVVHSLRAAVEERGEASIALAGGSTPKKLYEVLATLDVPWDRVRVYFGDERAVPPDDPKSNFRMAKEHLLDRVSVSEDQVRRMEGELSPSDAAARYARRLPERLDLVLLGMGSDGHTASLFPGGPELEATAAVVASQSPVAPHPRITLSLEALNRAREVVFLVAGGEKAERLRQVLSEIKGGKATLPAARVRPDPGRLCYYVDAAALPGVDD